MRKRSLAARRALSPEYRAAASAAICRKLVRSRQFSRAHRIAVYFANYDEVHLDAVIRAAWRSGKAVFAPRILRNEEMFFSEMSADSTLRKNRFGIWESLNTPYCRPEELDWVIAPLVAFDGALHRIGMGGGYYDRTFAFLKNGGAARKPDYTGVAFACQKTEEIPANPWDIGVSRIVTETPACAVLSV